MDQQKSSIGDYWDARARTSFWPTKLFSYRIGALLAWCLGRLGFTPNRVSLLSLVSTAAGLAAALYFCRPGWPQGIAIFVALNFAYSLDCADGLLARVSGKGTRFGAFFDKFIDVLGLALIAGLLGSAAGDTQWRVIHLPQALGVAFALGTRLALCVLMWLKEFEGSLPERLRPDERQRDLGWFVRRGAGVICDQVVYITVISIAWACGAFWDALWIYHCFILLLSSGYLRTIYRDGAQSQVSE